MWIEILTSSMFFSISSIYFWYLTISSPAATFFFSHSFFEIFIYSSCSFSVVTYAFREAIIFSCFSISTCFVVIKFSFTVTCFFLVLIYKSKSWISSLRSLIESLKIVISPFVFSIICLATNISPSALLICFSYLSIVMISSLTL